MKLVTERTEEISNRETNRGNGNSEDRECYQEEGHRDW